MIGSDNATSLLRFVGVMPVLTLVLLTPPSPRVLAFSEAPITAVYVSVDGVGLGAARRAGGPLYVLLWEPSLYLTGPHTISVKVEVSFRIYY